MSMDDFDVFLARFKGFNAEEKVKWLHLFQAINCFERAIKEDSSSIYSEALQLAQKALRYEPRVPRFHYIEAIASLRLFGDKDFAFKKYKLLMGMSSKEAIEFAIKLKNEIS